MKALQDWLNRQDIFARNAGAQITDINTTVAHAQMRITHEHLNAGGVCQGGAIFTLADLALAAVMNADRQLTFSLQTNIVFLASAHDGDILTATAKEVHAHHRAPYYEVIVTNDKDVHIATLSAVAYRKQQYIEL